MTSATQLKFSSDFSGPVTVSRWERSFPPLRTIEGAQLYPITKNSNFSFETGAKVPLVGLDNTIELFITKKSVFKSKRKNMSNKFLDIDAMNTLIEDGGVHVHSRRPASVDDVCQ